MATGLAAVLNSNLKISLLLQEKSNQGESFIEMIEIAAVRMEITLAPFLLKAACENCVATSSTMCKIFYVVKKLGLSASDVLKVKPEFHQASKKPKR
ncbi:hypothetical protein DV515_00003227 [Chloebia gouldiae]|uniref:Uncharacterized protein n=1 Tax=Chloebia gouldiae TaxID=44316 RepID=A0A3L8SU01_CHLGU|nr:hypothetical protein DV515_00003227 [Chloebia gouldiae]